MKVHELIANLHDVDPEGESDVQVFIRRRYGSTMSLADVHRELLAEQIELTQRHYAALLELQTVRDELTAVERRLAAIDAARLS